MRPAFHLTNPRPPDPQLDAAAQEIELLRSHFGGTVDYLYPTERYHRWLPRRWLPARQEAALLACDGEASFHHVVSSRLRTYATFDRLASPVVLRLMTPPDPRDRSTTPFAAVVVSSSADAETLRRWGLDRVRTIPPPIDVERLASVPPPPSGPLRLLMASAPWTRRQFRTKGVDRLLAAVASDPGLRLTLLWRGSFQAEIEARIARSPAADRIELITERVDVSEVLARCHAVVLQASNPTVVKAYPHSLLEGIAAGRPILVSSTLRISELVERTGCGIVTGGGTDALGEAIAKLNDTYAELRDAAAAVDLRPFSVERVVDAYRDLYSSL